MPEIRRLTGTTKPATATKPTGKAATPPARPSVRVTKPATEEVERVPTAAETKALQKAAGSVKLPAFLQRATLPQLISGELNGYVGFADVQSKNWPQMQAAGLEPGDPFMFKDGAYTILKPLKFFLVMGDTLRTTMEGQDGTFTFVTRDLETPLKDIAASVEIEGLTGKVLEAALNMRKSILKAEPHYVCLILVEVGETLVPIKADFRGTKTGAAESAVRAVEFAGTSEWLKQGEAHKVTAAYPHPFGRVWNVVTTMPKTGRTSGNNFFVARCQSKPATVTQMQLLIDHLAEEQFLEDFAEAERNYQGRLEFLDKVATGSEAV